MKKALFFVVCFLVLLICIPMTSAQAEEAAVYTITMTYNVQNIGSNKAFNVVATIDLFGNVSGWGSQEVISESITVDGEPISPEIMVTEDNRWMQISLGDFEPGQTKTIKVVQVLKVGAVDLNVNPSNVGDSIPQEVLIYTQPVDGLWESNDPMIQAVAKQFTDNTNKLYYKAKQIFDQVLEQPSGETLLTYELQNVEHGALWALQSKRGDCTEFSNMMVALMRAAGIPAKVVSGYAFLSLYNPAGASSDADKLGHAYVIFYLPNYGWVPADAVWPRYVGSFGQTDYAHIAGASIAGEGSVNSNGINWLSPGHISTKFQQYPNQQTTINNDFAGGTIEAEILLSSTLQTPSQINDGMMTVTLTAKNMGRSDATNVAAELDLDGSMFEMVTQKQEKASLVSQEQWVTSFDVRVKDSAYGTTQTIKAKVTFDSADGGASGTFLSTGRIPLAIPAKPSPPVTAPTQDFTLYIIIGAIVAVIVVLGVVIARR
ncbi:MAG: transglutaminase-like domain-containing protein [Methanobacteriota archaeon]